MALRTASAAPRDAPMHTVHITHRARGDIDAALAYIAADSPMNAAMLNDKFFDAMKSLAHFPERCPLALESEHWERPVRSMLVHRYRVLFEVIESRVIVLRVVHGMRRPLATPEQD
jgi:toxin ParE1/3/4